MNNTWQLAYLAVSRAARWNCLMTPAVLTQVPQTPLLDCPPPVDYAVWAPLTTYQANTILSYGGYYYTVMFTYTSTVNFENDLTTGALTQTNTPTNEPFFPPNGSSYPSGWQYSYTLPDDFQLLVELNGNTYWNCLGWAAGTTSNYQLMGDLLYCNSPQAVIQYVKDQPDTTQFDSLFTDALTFKWAAMVSTKLRQDGGQMEQTLEAAYDKMLKSARTKNAGEQQARRFNPINSSLFNAARYRGING